MKGNNFWLGLLVAAVTVSSTGVIASSSQGCIPDFFADGDCDSSNNSAECGYDSGDCCPCTCESTPYFTCGENGYECIDPNAACVDDDDVTADMVENCGSIRDMGNGYCDSNNNNEFCGYDGGDCCACTCVNEADDDYGCTGGFACIDPNAECVDDDDITVDMAENCGFLRGIGDGYCDDANNNELCGYDAGDCCECTCTVHDGDHEFMTDDYGSNGCTGGFACIDPAAACVDDDDITVDMVENCGSIRSVGDGYCDTHNNNELCGYDGGDCCECTCVVDDDDDEFMTDDYGSNGCTSGFACIDPAAACVDDDDITVDMVQNCGYVGGIGNGRCDSENNNEVCGYDGGDCCECTCTAQDGSDDYYGCTGSFACVDPHAACVDDDDITVGLLMTCDTVAMSNGYCDEWQNTPECNYDGRDCCSCTCEDTSSYTCGDGGFACVDPSAPCVDDDDITVDMLANCMDVVGIGNGYCSDHLNTPECNYDGGDCCACTCEVADNVDDDYSDGRYNGCTHFACVDPSAPCVDDDDITVDMLANCPYVVGIGDGYCSPDMNTPECNYDGGDCCACTCEVGEFTDDYSDGRHNGCTDFACVDPSAPCVDDDDITVDMLANCPYVLGIGDGYCSAEYNTPECNYDGGDCCPCTCESDDDYSCGMYGSEFNCLDPSAPCFGVVYKQQMSISENGHAFKVSRFADGRSTPYRIYFWDELLTGSSYRFDGNGDLVYFKAGSEVYYDIYKSDVDGDIKFSLKAESSGGESPEYDVKSDDPVQDIRENEFSCYQCWETVSAVCGDGRFRVGGLYKFCGAIDLQALDNDGTTSAEILCENADNTCSKAVAECASYCGVDDDDDSFTSGTFTTTSGTDDTHSGGYVEASTKTTVSVTASAYDERPGGESGGQGCGQHGCKPALAYDGISYDVESRWSCSKEIVHDEGQCEIEFTFEHPQDIVEMQVALWKGDERPRFLKVLVNGHKAGEFESEPGSVTTTIGIETHDVHTVTLESIGIDKDEWISILEVHFKVAP